MEKITLLTISLLYTMFSFSQSVTSYGGYSFISDKIELGWEDIPYLNYEVNNWFNSHGTPFYRYDISQSSASPTTLLMWHDGVLGEGVVRRYGFKPRSRYQVRALFSRYYCGDRREGEINMRLSNNDHPFTSDFGDPIISYNPQKVIYSEKVAEFTNEGRTIIVDFDTNNERWGSLNIYPRALLPYNIQVDPLLGDNLYITCLAIGHCSMAKDTTYCGGVIDTGLLDFYRDVYIGSSFCNYTSLTENQNEETRILSQGRIVIHNKTKLTATHNKPFIMSCEKTTFCKEDAPYVLDKYPCYDEKVIKTSIKQRQLFETKLYPNPATSVINIEGVNITEDIHCFDLLGQHIAIEGLLTKNSRGVQINIESFKQGVYFIRLIEKSMVLKFIKK